MSRSDQINPAGEYDTEFSGLVNGIVDHPKYRELKRIRHHDRSIYDHCLRVAWFSYRLGKLLGLKKKEIVKGALLHDFFFYDWRSERPRSGKLHAFEHPSESYQNALGYFSPIGDIEKDIILKHMWPLTLNPPRYAESLLVCLIDKIVATKEFSEDFKIGRRRKNFKGESQ